MGLRLFWARMSSKKGSKLSDFESQAFSSDIREKEIEGEEKERDRQDNRDLTKDTRDMAADSDCGRVNKEM